MASAMVRDRGWPPLLQRQQRRAALAAAALLGPLVLGAAVHAVERASGPGANSFVPVAAVGASALIAAGFVLAASLARSTPAAALRLGGGAYLAVGALNLAAWGGSALLRGALQDGDLPLLLGIALLAWPFHLLFAFGCNLGLADVGLWTTCAQ